MNSISGLNFVIYDIQFRNVKHYLTHILIKYKSILDWLLLFVSQFIKDSWGNIVDTLNFDCLFCVVSKYYYRWLISKCLNKQDVSTPWSARLDRQMHLNGHVRIDISAQHLLLISWFSKPYLFNSSQWFKIEDVINRIQSSANLIVSQQYIVMHL